MAEKNLKKKQKHIDTRDKVCIADLERLKKKFFCVREAKLFCFSADFAGLELGELIIAGKAITSRWHSKRS